MKKILTILILFAITFSLSAQNKVYEKFFLEDWTFDTDTSLYLKTHYDYRYKIQFEGNSLTGSYDGVIGFKNKMSDFEQYTYICSDTITVDGCKQTINKENFTFGIKDYYSMSDTLKIELYNNGITGGTANLKIKYFRNR